MTHLTNAQPPIPTTISDILRLVADAQHTPAADEEEPNELSAFIEFVTVFNQRFEQTIANAVASDAGASSGGATAHTGAFEDLFKYWEEIGGPPSLGWSFSGTTLCAISPAVLRTGLYHAACELPENGDIFLRMLGWRYLATQLAVRRALARQQHRDFQLGETESRLISAARAQRKILNGMLVSQDQVAGDLTALAVTAEDHDNFDSFLVTVSELSDVSRDDRLTLVSRAREALSNRSKPNIHHCILMADSINRDSMRDSTYYYYDQHIHLIGEPDEVRYIIFVSDVPDQSQPFVPPEDVYEGRFRLDRSRLKDVFLRRRREDKHGYAGTSASLSHTIPWRMAVSEPVPLLDVFIAGRSVLKDLSETKDTDEGVISREKVSRRFFGYKPRDVDL